MIQSSFSYQNNSSSNCVAVSVLVEEIEFTLLTVIASFFDILLNIKNYVILLYRLCYHYNYFSVTELFQVEKKKSRMSLVTFNRLQISFEVRSFFIRIARFSLISIARLIWRGQSYRVFCDYFILRFLCSRCTEQI